MANHSRIIDGIKFSCSTTIETVGKGYISTFKASDDEGDFQQTEVFTSEIELIASLIRSFIHSKDIEAAWPRLMEAVVIGQASDDAQNTEHENIH